MFKKILLPSDGSEAALRAARTAASLIRSAGAVELTVAVVVMPLDIGSTDMELEFVQAHNSQVRRQADLALEKTSRVLEEQKIPHTCKILEGTPVSAILAKEAGSGNYDLVVMSSRGMGMQKDTLHYMGSVTEHLIRRVSIPVLVIPVDEGSYRD